MHPAAPTAGPENRAIIRRETVQTVDDKACQVRLAGHAAKFMLQKKQTGQSPHADILMLLRALISRFYTGMFLGRLVLWVILRHGNVTPSQNFLQRSWSFPAIIVK